MPQRLIGITSTVPVEFVFASGRVPCDLNNRFINGTAPGRLLERVEAEGFPKAYCAWIKGIYAVAMRERFREIIVVTQGDCSNTIALAELLQARGVHVVTFAYPYGRGRGALEDAMHGFADALGAEFAGAEEWFDKLAPVRRKLHELDWLTWKDGKVTGAENLRWLVSASDFEGDPDAFGKRLDDFLAIARAGQPKRNKVRLALAGVPPILSDLHETAASLGADIVLNEMPCQFALPRFESGLVEAYLEYTYPYDIFHRLDDLRTEIERRGIDGVLHYAQTFCYRQLGEVLMRERLGVPVLSVEADAPGPVTDSLRVRLEAFIEMLAAGKR